MWKRLDESIGLSEKLASLSWTAFGVWAYLLAQTDTMGRFPRDSRVVKAKCITMRYDLRLDLVEEALLEIERAGLLHCFDVEGKRYLVLHDYVSFNPPGAIGKVSPKYPEPPTGLCKCTDLERRANGVRTPDVTSPVTYTSSPDGVQGEDQITPGSPEAMIVGILERKDCPSAPKTIRRYARGWISDKGFQFVEQATMDPWCKGKDVIAIHDRFFREQRPKSFKPASPATKAVKCQACGDSGTQADYDNGAIKLVPCRCKRVSV